MKSSLYGLIYRALFLILFKFNNEYSVICTKHDANKNNCSSIRIRAMLVKCSKKDTFDVFKETSNFNRNISLIRSKDILQFPGYDKDEIQMHSKVRDCRKKLIFTVKLKNCGRTKTEDEFIVIDHVYDPAVRKTLRLLNPVVFKFKQEQVQLYGLRFLHMVNAEAREEVLNKNMANFTGCDATSSKPTCGLSYLKNEVIPFSEGFCCSCDSFVNLQRQPKPAGLVKGIKKLNTPQQYTSLDEAELYSVGNPYAEKIEEDAGSSNKQFFVKGLWGDLYDSKFQEEKSFRVRRSEEDNKNIQIEPNSNETRLKSNTESINDIFNEIFNISENNPNNNDIFENNDIVKISSADSKAITCDEFESINDARKLNSNFRQKSENYTIRRDRNKQYFLKNDKQSNDFVKQLKNKNRSKVFHVFGSQASIRSHVKCLKRHKEPPLEFAKGFTKTCRRKPKIFFPDHRAILKSNRKSQFINQNYCNGCKKSIVNMSKPLQQAIDFQNCLDLNLEDINEKKKLFKPKFNVRSKNESTSKNRNEEHSISSNCGCRLFNELNHHHNYEDRSGQMEALGSITHNKISSNESNFVDVSFEGTEDNLGILYQDLKQMPDDYLVISNHTNSGNSGNNKNSEDFWVESVDYDVSDSFLNKNNLMNDSFEMEGQDNFYSENNTEEKVNADHRKRRLHGSKLNIFFNEGNPKISCDNYFSVKTKDKMFRFFSEILDKLFNDKFEQYLLYRTNTPGNVINKIVRKNYYHYIYDDSIYNKNEDKISQSSYNENDSSQVHNSEEFNPLLRQNSPHDIFANNLPSIPPVTVIIENNKTNYGRVHNCNNLSKFNIIKLKSSHKNSTNTERMVKNNNLGRNNSESYNNYDSFKNHFDFMSSTMETGLLQNNINNTSQEHEKINDKYQSIELQTKRSNYFNDGNNDISNSEKDPNFPFPEFNLLRENLNGINKELSSVKSIAEEFTNLNYMKNNSVLRKSDKTEGSFQEVNHEFQEQKNSVSHNHNDDFNNNHNNNNNSFNNIKDYKKMFEDVICNDTEEIIKMDNTSARKSQNTASANKPENINSPFALSNSSCHSNVIFSNFLYNDTNKGSNQNQSSCEILDETQNVSIDQAVRGQNRKISTNIKTKSKRKIKRQVVSNGFQVRGGQNCIDRAVPKYGNHVTYHESAHCLRFSDLWYHVYRLKKPFIEHSIQVQLFEKNDHPDGRTKWHELTKGMSITVGTFKRGFQDAVPNIAISYTTSTDEYSGVFSLDSEKATLLIPQSLPSEKSKDYPQLKGGPMEYMLVRESGISFDGEDCDKAGVSFEAFARQPDRCGQPRGTCLKNQPIHLWKEDMDARENNKRGKYFLENYALVSRTPIKMKESTHEKFLSFDYTGKFSSDVDVEARLDNNDIVRTGSSAQITEIHVDCSCEFHTRISVIATNLGLASSSFFPKLTSCPVEVQEVWTNSEGPLVVIPPQHRHVFRMSLFGSLPVDQFYCSMELLNERKELVAMRRVRFHRHDRCVCLWHCLCSCAGSLQGLRCLPMSIQHYHAAGFLGSLPVITSTRRVVKESTKWKFFILYFSSVLNVLIMGLIKATLGLCCSAGIGSWGLWLMFPFKAKNLDAYKEPNISRYSVERDDAGYLIHPIYRTRNIRFLSKAGEFFSNIIFFAVAPVMIGLKMIEIYCPFINNVAAESDGNDKSYFDCKGHFEYSSTAFSSCSYKEHQGKGSTETQLSNSKLDEDEREMEYITDETEASQKNFKESTIIGLYRRNSTILSENTFSESQKELPFVAHKNNRENLSELEKEMAEQLVNTLLDTGIVYRNFKSPIGGVNLQKGISYCLEGGFTFENGLYHFVPMIPVMQYWTIDLIPVSPPLPLDMTVFEMTYPTAEEVLLANELSLLPRGVVVNNGQNLSQNSR